MVKKVSFVLAAAVLSAAGVGAQDAAQLFNNLRVPPKSVQAFVTKDTLKSDIDRFIDVNGWDKLALNGFFVYAGADAGEPNFRDPAEYINLGLAYGFSSMYLAFSVTKQDNLTLMFAHKTPGAFRLNLAISENPAFGFEWGKNLKFASGGVLDLDYGTAVRLSGTDEAVGIGMKMGVMYHTKSKWDIGGYIIPFIGLEGRSTGLNFLFKSGKTIEAGNLSLGLVPKAVMCIGFGSPLDVSVDLGFKYKIKKTFGIYSGMSVSLFSLGGSWSDFGLNWVTVDGQPLAIGVSIEPSKTFTLQAYVKNNFLAINSNATGGINLNDQYTFLGNATSWQVGIVVSCKVDKLSDLGDVLD